MAKGKSSRGSATASASSLTSLLALSQPAIVPVNPLDDPIIRNQLFHGRYHDPAGDRRRFRPDKSTAPPHALIRSATRLHIGAVARPFKTALKSQLRKEGLPTKVGFRIPNVVAICIRRKIRREVLHALNRRNTGRGGKRNRNFWSDVKC